MKKPDKLSPKLKRFCDEYLVDNNGKRAAIAAGYSKKTAEVCASKMLRIPKLAAYIAQKTAKKCEKLEITAERVMQEIAKLAFYDVRKLVDDNGKLLPFSKIDDNTAAAIGGIDIVTRGNSEISVGEITKVKLSDKTKSLELLARHLKLLTDKTELTGADGKPLIPIIKDDIK